jgi:predicted ATPase
LRYLQVRHLKNRDELTPFFTDCKKEIELALTGNHIMYFPTYRRVEENLDNFVYGDDKQLNSKNELLQFGMEDVQKQFNQIEQTIDRYLKEGFSKISSEILSQLVKGFPQVDPSFLSRITETDIEIILARVGSQLSTEDKDDIRKIVFDQNIDNPSLTYFLQKLVEIYEQQKELDNSVKVFRDTCNRYLVDKELFYDESAIKIFIKSAKNSAEIPLDKLSSGEKQIISIFSKIYLSEKESRFIVLFDEPELSLSMPWQKQLLPDILNSKKCTFLLAVTHSPFIFDNELDPYAVGLNEYIHLSKTITA